MIETTLGISLGHDSGVCLLRNNEVLFAANEERFSRTKGHAGFPHLALKYVLSNFDIEIEKVALDGEFVAPHGIQDRYNMEGSESLTRKIVENLRIANFLIGTTTGVTLTRVFFKLFHKPARMRHRNQVIKEFRSFGRKKPSVTYVDHHIAHAFSILPDEFPKDNSMIITLDGMGEGLCSRVISINNGEISKLAWQSGLASPALMYGYITKILGFRMNRHEGKVTGLAAYGDGGKTKEIIRQYFDYNPERNKFLARNIKWGPGGEKAIAKKLRVFSKEDIAAGAQDLLEELVLAYFAEINKRHANNKITRFYVAGGLFANVKLNQRIVQQSFVESLHVAPNMGDGGLALGAARYTHKHELITSHLYLGSEIANHVINDERIQNLPTENLVNTIADFLSAGKIVAIASGKMEYGPRALGNRSILYDAGNKDVNQWLNSQLNRTEFMPFAPIGRIEDSGDYFHLDQNAREYQNMTITCDVTDLCKLQAPAIVHIDGTARPQLVTKERNELIWKILTQYKSITGKGLLVNTSFNLHEEPIVRTAEEAIESFSKAHLDLLVLGDKLFQRT